MKNIMLVAIAGLLVFLLTVAIAVIILSPGRLRPLTNESGRLAEGSDSEKIFVEICGVRQGMFIRGRN